MMHGMYATIEVAKDVRIVASASVYMTTNQEDWQKVEREMTADDHMCQWSGLAADYGMIRWPGNLTQPFYYVVVANVYIDRKTPGTYPHLLALDWIVPEWAD